MTYYRIWWSDGTPGRAMNWEDTLALIKMRMQLDDLFFEQGIIPVRVEPI